MIALATSPPPARYGAIVGDSLALGAGREVSVIAILLDVARMLRELPTSPRVRELRAQARAYDLATKQWAVVAPTGAGLDAMFELVTDLRRKSILARNATG